MPVDVIRAVLRVVLDDEDHRVLPARAVGDELDGQPERGVVVLHEALERPVRPVGIDVAGAAAVIVRIVQIDVRSVACSTSRWRSTYRDSNTCLKRPKRLKRVGSSGSGASGMCVL